LLPAATNACTVGGAAVVVGDGVDVVFVAFELPQAATARANSISSGNLCTGARVAPATLRAR
jgi:hypothetical protein